MKNFDSFRTELKPMVQLAAPIVMAELGWMTMAIVDTMMVGRLPNSAEAIGAVSLGSIVFYTVAIFGTGLLLGLDTLVSQSFGAGKMDDVHHSLLNGIYLSLALAPVLMGISWLSVPLLRLVGVSPAVLRLAIPYLGTLIWSTLPLLLYFVFRRYLQGMNLVAPVMFALISANLINLAGNWIFIYGHLGAPALGVRGSGWSTCVSRIYMAGVLLVYILLHDHRRKTGLRDARRRPSFARMSQLIGLGFPAAMQFSFEVGVFAVATALIGKLGPVPLASHQVALNTVSLSYMVPLGIASAAAVRVGQALGRGDFHAAGRSGWTALALGAGFMCCAALAFLIVPYYIVRIYTPDPVVIKAGVKLLFVAAFFQLFDGVQTVTTGALRGAGDTRSPMICHLIAYWVLGLPLGYFLCFKAGWGAPGMWTGLCVALILIGLALLFVWRRTVHSFFPRVAPVKEVGS
jgi:MATE family multidrug resistance protein